MSGATVFENWTEADLSELAALERRCFSDPWSEAELRSTFLQPTFKGLLLRENGLIVAYACVIVVCEQADICIVAVSPEKRRQGLGEKILQALVSLVKESGGEEIFLEVRTSNRAARSLYERGGFEEIGVRRRYYADGEDAVVMKKRV